MHEMLHGAGFANTMFNYARDGEGRRKGLIELREVRDVDGTRDEVWFFVKGRAPRHVFGGIYDSSISMPSFSPLPTENPMRAPLSSSGYYEAPTGV